MNSGLLIFQDIHATLNNRTVGRKCSSNSATMQPNLDILLVVKFTLLKSEAKLTVAPATISQSFPTCFHLTTSMFLVAFISNYCRNVRSYQSFKLILNLLEPISPCANTWGTLQQGSPFIPSCNKVAKNIKKKKYKAEFMVCVKLWSKPAQLHTPPPSLCVIPSHKIQCTAWKPSSSLQDQQRSLTQGFRYA